MRGVKELSWLLDAADSAGDNPAAMDMVSNNLPPAPEEIEGVREAVSNPSNANEVLLGLLFGLLVLVAWLMLTVVYFVDLGPLGAPSARWWIATMQAAPLPATLLMSLCLLMAAVFMTNGLVKDRWGRVLAPRKLMSYGPEFPPPIVTYLERVEAQGRDLLKAEVDMLIDARLLSWLGPDYP